MIQRRFCSLQFFLRTPIIRIFRPEDLYIYINAYENIFSLTAETRTLQFVAFESSYSTV